MKFFIHCILSAIISLLLGPFIPYWGLMIVIGIAAALIGGRGIVAFLGSGLGMALVWFAVPLWVTIRTGSELPLRIGAIMGLDNPMILILITSLIGFLLAGFSAWTGNSFRKIFNEPDMPY
ncbi:MAG TPA: hypothetical protein VK921_12410 [Anditalea sp.]|nr:hypothetical protein [Anditalea sp.]